MKSQTVIPDDDFDFPAADLNSSEGSPRDTKITINDSFCLSIEKHNTSKIKLTKNNENASRVETSVKCSEFNLDG